MGSLFNLTEKSIIYIVAPPSYTSGGPELLHQLCHILRNNGMDARMYYFDTNSGHRVYESPKPNKFNQYNTIYDPNIEDNIKNLLIVPENINSPLEYYKKIQKCVWWLGANNYFWLEEVSENKYLRFIYHWSRFLIGKKTPLSFSRIKKQNTKHLAQCWYTISFLTNKGLNNIPYLSDYTNEIYKEIYEKGLYQNKKRKNLILYNPKRNQKILNIIKRKVPQIQFIAIENMKNEQIIELMCSSKIYMDFGSHPGKDRLPREAVMCGCCVITSTLGSAGYYEDLPISSEFKFARNKENINEIIKKIYYIFDNYESETVKFDYYRNVIYEEKNKFIEDVNKIFLN